VNGIRTASVNDVNVVVVVVVIVIGEANQAGMQPGGEARCVRLGALGFGNHNDNDNGGSLISL
jgi:hypothetical protein